MRQGKDQKSFTFDRTLVRFFITMHVTFSSKYFNSKSTLDDMGFLRTCSLCAVHALFKLECYCQCPLNCCQKNPHIFILFCWSVMKRMDETHVIQLAFKVSKQHHRPHQKEKAKERREKAEEEEEEDTDVVEETFRVRSAYWHHLQESIQSKQLLISHCFYATPTKCKKKKKIYSRFKKHPQICNHKMSI